MKDVCQVVYKNALKKRQEMTNGSTQSLTVDFTDDYPCEEWSGNNGEFMLQGKEMIPLQHVAILPEGIVTSYHPYQIGGLSEGDCHILVPFKDVGEYLLQDYSKF